MYNKIEESAPPREERLKAGIAFVGSCSKMKQCMREGGCFHLANRRFSQTYGCQFSLSLGILNTIRNAVVIMHGPIGCGFCSTASIGQNKSLKQLREKGAKGLLWLNTNLEEADVINGGEKKLIEAILYAEKEFQPELILVANSCVPALIGDDVTSILEQVQSEVKAKLVGIYCEGFKTKVMATAYDAVYNGILKVLLEEKGKKEQQTIGKRKKQLVNIFNVGSMSRADEKELTRLLQAIGLEVRYFPCYSDNRIWNQISEATLNVSICGTHDDYILHYLEKEYGIPYLIDTIPIGKKNTERWLKKIAAFFHLTEEVERFIQKEEQLLDEALEEFRVSLQGKRVFISGGEIRVAATAEIVQELQMEVVGMKGHHIDSFILPVLEQVEKIEDTLLEIATQQPFEQANIVQRLEPDLIIIHTGGNNISAKHGVPILPLYGTSYNYMGFSGVYEMSRKINKIVKNASFNKNMKKYRSLPYKESWYHQSPSFYIKDR